MLSLIFIFVALMALSGVVILLLKIGVVVQKAGERPHIDGGTYTIEQGHEVTNQDDPRHRR